MFWTDEITISAKKITLIDYQQQIVFLIGPINYCLVLLIFLVMYFGVLDLYGLKKPRPHWAQSPNMIASSQGPSCLPWAHLNKVIPNGSRSPSS